MAGEQKNAKDAHTPRRGLSLVLAAAVLAVIGAGWFLRGRSSDSAPRPDQGSRDKSVLHLETFVLNITDPGQRSYLRVSMDLGLDREAKRGQDEVPVARVRDTILEVLEQSTLDDLLSAKGKAKLKEDIKRALQQRVPELGVQEVYFTEFLIQR